MGQKRIGEGGHAGYVAAKGRAATTILMISIMMLVNGASIVQGTLYFRDLAKSTRYRYSLEPNISVSDFHLLPADIRPLLILITGITFVLWFYRAHKNLKPLGARNLKYASRWAVIGFVVPLLHIVRPYQLAQEIWKASNPAEHNGDWQKRSDSIHIFLWWVLFLLALFYIGWPDYLPQNDINLTMRSAIVSDVMAVLSGFFAIALVRDIQKRQAERYKTLSACPPANTKTITMGSLIEKEGC